MDQELLFCNEEEVFSGSPWSGENVAEVLDESPGNDSHIVVALTDFPPRDDAALKCVVYREQTQMPDSKEYAAALQGEADIAHARFRAVNWMLKVRNAYAFSPMTAALATSYLDRYLAKLLPRPFKAWVIQLLAIACVSLAAKMEEISVRVLSDLQIEGLENIFEPKTIQRMELVVLKALGWRMSGVTAFEYVDDLLYRLDISRQTRASILARITELILGTLPEAAFVTFPPSVVALAAFSCALDEIVPLKADMYQNLLLAALPTNQATLHRCYRLMEDVIVDPLLPGVAPSQTFATSKSPPSPLTVIEIYQTGDVGNGEFRRNMDWSIKEVTHVNLRKRKLDVEKLSDNKRRSSQRVPENCGSSVWDLF